MTPAQLNSRVKTYRAMIARWEAMLAEGHEIESLRNDIRDLNSWINALIQPYNKGPTAEVIPQHKKKSSNAGHHPQKRSRRRVET